MPALVAVYQISVAFAQLFRKSYRFITQFEGKKNTQIAYELVESNIEIISAERPNTLMLM